MLKSINWKGREYTTIHAIAIHYVDKVKILDPKAREAAVKFVKSSIYRGVKKLDNVKLSTEEVKAKEYLLSDLIRIPVTNGGLLLIPKDKVESVESSWLMILKQVAAGTYKTDRFKAKRDLKEELNVELHMKNLFLDSSVYSALLSYCSRLEKGQPKVMALRASSKNFGVTQKVITETFAKLDLQIDYKNLPREMR